jgi:nucleoside triphosphatase
MAQQYPEPVVGALIANPEGKVLLVKSYKWPDQYVIPGGHIELGETMEEALKREMKEETGLDIYDIEHAWLGESVFQNSFHEKKHFIFINFVCKTDSCEVMLNDELQEYVWVSPQEALELTQDPDLIPLVEKINPDCTIRSIFQAHTR